MRDIVNLEDWPIDRLNTAEGHALVQKCQADIAEQGMFNLAGFLRPEAIQRIVADVTEPLETASFRHARRHNIYFKKSIEGLPPDPRHPQSPSAPLAPPLPPPPPPPVSQPRGTLGSLPTAPLLECRRPC